MKSPISSHVRISYRFYQFICYHSVYHWLLYNKYPNSTEPFTLRWRNLKTEVSLWKRINVSVPSTLRRRNFTKTQKSMVILNFCFRKTGVEKSHVVKSWFAKSSKCFPSTRNAKPAFTNSSCLKIVFEKLHFRDGSAWTAGLTVEIKLRRFPFLRPGVEGAKRLCYEYAQRTEVDFNLSKMVLLIFLNI